MTDPHLEGQLRLGSLRADTWEFTRVLPATLPVGVPVSLVGRWTPVPAPAVTELEYFDVEVFPVSDTGQQAIAIAINTREGCRGLADQVQYFIGAEDYGVITDEYTLQGVARYRFRSGDFPNVLGLETRARFTRDGSRIDGTVHGALQLGSLDSCAIEFDSNTRLEALQLRGAGVVTVDHAVLDNGTVLTASQLRGISEALSIGWAVVTVPTVDDRPVSEAYIRQFQDQLHSRLYQYFAKPFSLEGPPTPWPSPSVDYVRLWPLPGYIYCLGTVPDALLPYISQPSSPIP